jgi:uncharacterized protein (DUF2267 family)
MEYEQFLALARERGQFINERETLIAIESTLKTLGERLTEDEAAQLATHLPPDIGRFLTVVDTDKDYNLTDFYEHVASRERLDTDTSRRHAAAVLSVVETTIGAGTLRGLIEHLPEEYTNLFPALRGG